MKIEIINIGDEILIGQVINTNAAWMAEELNRNGFKVFQFTVISDKREHILQALNDAQNRADLVLVSGGIGPTRDDITKQTICEFFETKLVFNQDAFRDIEILFGRRGYKITELNRKQAELPESCIPLPNRMGTARGMWFEKERGSRDEGRGTRDVGREANNEDESGIRDPGSGIFVFLPGVPFEMKDLFTREVIPRLKERFTPTTIYHKTVMTQGKGESFMADILEAWENNLPKHISLAYLPQPGIVRLRFTAVGEQQEELETEVDDEIRKLHKLIPDLIFGYDTDTLEAVVGQLLMVKNQSLATAESCTGGYIAHLITSIAGSSSYFKGSIVAYSNEAKQNILYVKEDSLVAHGAVSEQVVLEMALGARDRFRTDYSIATSGIAGPTGGTQEKPVGTVWIAIATPERVFAKHYLFGNNRERNIRRTALQALNLLRKEL
ncbi:MAG: nicotinamide-nucleotide amidohydrolase family protein [Bacteroidales bacterium]|nr:nicotinamide-nucleotide amidohydrolase family protein [Bacteroidota bacterium]MBL6949626.1 nicotinamide-nucleotide amidohydrolase family protein [Bacteroidales bacterium]